MEYNKPTIIIYRHDTLGGTGTLSYRLGKWFIENNYEVIYLCEVFNDMNNVNDMLNVGVKVRKWKYKDIISNLNSEFGKKEYIVLSYSMYEFLRIEMLRKKIRIVKNLIYIVGSNELIKGSNSNIIIKTVAKKFYKNIIEELLQNNQMIFMQKYSFILAKEYYGLEVIDDESLIFLLPMQTKEYNQDIVFRKKSKDKFEILTIARADFPFKGYIIGLIDEFSQLCTEYNNLYLTIIAYGDDEEQIKNKIQSLPKERAERINLVGLTPYNELKTYFQEAKLYVGMGTTVLDAVNHSTPAVIVLPHTYECKTSGYFHMQPESLRAYENKLLSFYSIVKKVIEMNDYDYEQLCKLENTVLNEKYNINDFGEFITVSNNKEPKILKSFYLYFNSCFYALRKFFNKLKND